MRARAHLIMHIVFNNKLNSFSRQPMQPPSWGTHNVSHHCCYLFTPATSRCNRISDCSRFGPDQSASPCLHVFLRPNGLLCASVLRASSHSAYIKKEEKKFCFFFIPFHFIWFCENENELFLLWINDTRMLLGCATCCENRPVVVVVDAATSNLT